MTHWEGSGVSVTSPFYGPSLTAIPRTVAFVLLDIIRKSKFRIPDEPLGRIQAQSGSRMQGGGGRPPTSAVDSNFPRKARSGWRSRVGSEKLKDLTIGMILQPRRWSL
jgi:hypothetical protein